MTTRRLIICGPPGSHPFYGDSDYYQPGDEKAPVGQGYRHKPDQTCSSFKAHLSDTGEGPFLRTGDLGFMREGQLYVTGRQDDLIVVRGVSRYPQDIEATARSSHPLLEAGYGAAFVVDDHGRPRLVLVQEATRKGHEPC